MLILCIIIGGVHQFIGYCFIPLDHCVETAAPLYKHYSIKIFCETFIVFSRIHLNPVDRNRFSSIVLYPAFYEYKNVQSILLKLYILYLGKAVYNTMREITITI